MQTKDDIYKRARELTDRVGSMGIDSGHEVRDALYDLCQIVASLAAHDTKRARPRWKKK